MYIPFLYLSNKSLDEGQVITPYFYLNIFILSFAIPRFDRIRSVLSISGQKDAKGSKRQDLFYFFTLNE